MEATQKERQLVTKRSVETTFTEVQATDEEATWQAASEGTCSSTNALSITRGGGGLRAQRVLDKKAGAQVFGRFFL